MKYLTTIVLAAILASPAHAQFADFNDRGVAFAHVHVVVADVDLHASLWSGVFGAALTEKEGYTAARISNALVYFRQGTPSAPSNRTAMDHVGLDVRNLEDVLSKWRALGYDVGSESTGAARSPSAVITMPGGIRLVLRENPGQAESTSIDHVHFSTPTRRELMDWYVARFGAGESTLPDSDSALAISGARLGFDDTASDRLPTDGAAIDHIGFEIEHWEAFVATLKEDGIQFEFGPAYIESLDLWVAFFNDPSGVLVEITHGLDRF